MFGGTNILLVIIIGALAGWLADMLVPGVKVGLLGAIIAGILGGILGGWLFALLKISTQGILMFVAAVVGAVIVLLIYRAIAKR